MHRRKQGSGRQLANVQTFLEEAQEDRLQRKAEAARSQPFAEQQEYREVMQKNKKFEANQDKLWTEDDDFMEKMLELKEAYDEILLFSTSKTKSLPSDMGFHIAGL